MKSRRKWRRSATGGKGSEPAATPQPALTAVLPATPRRRPGRRLWLAGALALLLIAAAALWFAAPQIAGSLARTQLEAMGIPQPRLTVTSLGLESTVIEDLALGAADELTAERIELGYDLFAQGPSPLTRVALTSPRLSLDLTGGPLLGSLQPLLGGGEESAETDRALPPLPGLEIDDGLIQVDTPLGPATVAVEGGTQPLGAGAEADIAFRAESGPARLAGRLTGQAAPEGRFDGQLTIEEGALALAPDQAGVAAELSGLTGGIDFALDGTGLRSARGQLALTGLGLEEARFRDAEVGFALTEEAVTAEGLVLSEDGGLRLEFDGGITELRSDPRLDVSADLFVRAEAALLARAGSPLESGVGRLTLDLQGDLPALAERPEPGTGQAPAQGTLPWLLSGAVEGRMALVFSDLAVPERFTGADGQIAGPLILADGTAAFTLDSSAEIHVATLNGAWLESLGLPAELAGAFTEGAVLRLGPNDPLPAGLSFQPTGEGFEAVADGHLELAPEEAGAAEGPRLSARLLQARAGIGPDFGIRFLDLPDAAASLSRVTLNGIPVAMAEIAASAFGTPDDLEADARLTALVNQARLGDLTLRDLELALPLHLILLDGAVEAFPAEPGEITLGGLSHASGLSLRRPASATLRDAAFLFSPPSAAGTGGDRLAHDLRISLGRTALALTREDGEALEIDLEPASLRIIGEREGQAAYHGRANLSGGGFDLSGLDISAEGLNATADFTAALQVPSARFSAKSLTLAGAPPLSLEGNARRQGRQVTLEARATPVSQIQFDDFPPARFSAVYDTASGNAQVSLSPLRLVFQPGGLQPADLAPQLSLLQNVAGSAELAFDGRWQGEALLGNASLVASDLSFTQADTRVEGLDLSLVLDQLWPPRSPPGQSLRVARLESVTPIENVEAAFAIRPGDPAQALVQMARLSLIGGRFQIRDTVIDPSATQHETTLEVLSIALNELFTALDVAGLTGSGTMTGRLPITVDGDVVTIEKGRLESTGPGVLSYIRAPAGSGAPPPDLGIEGQVEGADSAPPPDLPEDAAERSDSELLQDPMALAMKALENFHYDRLVLELDKKAGGETEMQVQLEGKNPDLLDGYPFKFNINLKADITPLLEALDRGLTLSRGLLGGAWKLSP